MIYFKTDQLMRGSLDFLMLECAEKSPGSQQNGDLELVHLGWPKVPPDSESPGPCREKH